MPGLGASIGNAAGTVVGGPLGGTIGNLIGSLGDALFGGKSAEEIAAEEQKRREAYYAKNGHWPEDPMVQQPGKVTGTFNPGAGPSGTKWTQGVPGSAGGTQNPAQYGTTGNSPVSGLPVSGSGPSGEFDSAGKWNPGGNVSTPLGSVSKDVLTFGAIGLLILFMFKK